jgi:antitoxin VapB
LYILYTTAGGKMPLSIRNQKAEKLARELAAESGETITQAITHALEERLARIRGRSTVIDLMEEVLKISKRCSAIPDQDQRSADEILGYDDRGVPQ